ncbi:unnamed protein product, partial [Polarella glacialis]
WHEVGGLLRQCLALLQCKEGMYEGLSAQLLEQLLEAPALRQRLRRLRALPVVLSHLRLDSPDISGEGRGVDALSTG